MVADCAIGLVKKDAGVEVEGRIGSKKHLPSTHLVFLWFQKIEIKMRTKPLYFAL